MTIRWSPEATDDFIHLIEHIRNEQPSAAERIAHRIYNSISELAGFPKLGRPGRLKNSRELVLAPLPFIVVYRANEEAVEIARILHGAQRWP